MAVSNDAEEKCRKERDTMKILYLFFVVEINFGNKIIRYIEDLSEVLGIGLGTGE